MANTLANKPKLYGVKDIVEICGLDRNKVFYWTKILNLIEPDYITPGRQLFKFEALLDFRLISELRRMGLSPDAIRSIVWIEDKVRTETGAWVRRWPIWRIFADKRDMHERLGYFLFSREKQTDSGPDVEYSVCTARMLSSLWFHETKQSTRTIGSAIVINLLNIIHEVEGKAGERLE